MIIISSALTNNRVRNDPEYPFRNFREYKEAKIIDKESGRKRSNVPMEQPKDFFTKIEWYAVKIVSTAVFLAILYAAARYEIAHLLGK